MGEELGRGQGGGGGGGGGTGGIKVVSIIMHAEAC